MKVTEILERTGNPLISYEIIPPKRGSSLQYIFDLVDELLPFEPPFIDVTSHAAEVYYEELQDGVVKKHVKRKRPGTLGLCAALKSKYGIEAVPHILCEGFTREETEDALIELNYLGIQNVMALRGDGNGFQKPTYSARTRNEFAKNLVKQIDDMNHGNYLEDLIDAAPTEFCVGVAGYPEKHFEAPNLNMDIAFLKQKVDAGADYIVTQMFFENKYFFEFVEKCRAAGIEVPIIPGIKLLANKRQLFSLPKHFYIEIPESLAMEVQNAKPEDVPIIGEQWAIEQTMELMEAGFSIHFYIMQRASHILKVVETLRKKA